MQFLAFFIMLAMVGGINFYMAHFTWRWLHQIVPKFSILFSFIFFAVLTALMILSFLKPLGGILQRISYTLGVWCMGFFIYFLIFFVVADLLMLIPWAMKLSSAAMIKLRIGAGIGATVLTILISIYGFCHAQRIYTVEYDVEISDNPTNEMSLVLVSDIHLGALGSEVRLEKIAAKINEIQPDMVCIAGDLFDNDFKMIENPQKAAQTIGEIRSRYSTFACLGNHDAGSTFGDMEAFYEQAGINLLTDEHVVIDNSLILGGRLDPYPIMGAGDYKRADLTKVLDGADVNLPVVMLDHNPMSVDTYDDRVDLVLSGHTHRGQVFPGSIITNAMYTVDYGHYRAENGLQAIVTSGAGIWGLPMRVGTNCEIVKINLKY